MPKPKLDDLGDFFEAQPTSKKQTPPVKQNNKTSGSKKGLQKNKNDIFENKTIPKGAYLTEELSHLVDTISGFKKRSKSDIICEALDNLFSTPEYKKFKDLIK